MGLDGGGGGGGGGILGAGNQFTGAGAAIEFVGRGYWGGWSGIVNAINGADGTLFTFKSPTSPLDVILSLQIDQTNLTANESVGYNMTMGGLTVINFLAVVTANNSFFDLDPIYFVLPALTETVITCTTSDGQNIPFTALIRAVEI